MSSKDAKWDCTNCTYRNFLVSRKCVMCGQTRPSQVISDLENSEQDIYKVAELEARNNEGSCQTSNKDAFSHGKEFWTCKNCSTRNQHKSKQCYQCKLKCNFKVPEMVESDIVTAGSSTLPTLPSKSVVKPAIRTPVLSGSRSQDGLTHKGSAGMSSLLTIMKWSCSVCTYDNQPKNKKCAMCSTPREKQVEKIVTDPVTVTSTASLQLEIDVNTKNQENIRSGQNSPNTKSGDKPEQISNSIKKEVPSDNNRFSPGSNQHSGQNSPRCSSGNDSAGILQASMSSPNTSLTSRDCIIPYTSNSSSSSGQTSPKQSSPTNNRSGPVSPQEHVTGQSSPTNNKRGSPLVARASKSNRNQNRVRTEDGAGAIGGYREDDRHERKIQKLRKKLSSEDILWLSACESVVKGDLGGIERYLTSGGYPARQLTKDEVIILDRPSSFEVGYTLVHLALRFRRDDMVAILLAATDIVASKGFKRLPSFMCPDLSSTIRRDISVMLRQKKGTFPCYFLTEFSTFTLPADIEDLPRNIQSELFEEILDTHVDKELIEESVINWSIELTEKHGSRLYALWNRTAGDCLLDSVLQATWGILDVDNTLRKALADSLAECANSFYPKWKEYESRQADMLNFSLDDEQWHKDWAILLNLASQPGASLEQMHIFALAHILRRPIIVYGVKVVKSYKGESIDFARFEGVYLPLLWDRHFCSRVPIALGYTRGHFSALVPMELDTDMPLGAGAHIDNAVDEQIFYLPLIDHEGAFLPIHFLSGAEMGQEETIFRRWFECYVTQDAHFVALQRSGKRPPLVGQMLEMWLDYYRQQAHTDSDLAAHGFSSDADSDQE